MGETFLISNTVPYRICERTQRVFPVEPLMDVYELSQPDPRMEGVRVKMPREIVDRILDELVKAYLRTKEFGLAVFVGLVDVKTLERMVRTWVDPLHLHHLRDRLGEIHCDKKQRWRWYLCRSRALFRLFYLGMVLFDHAWDKTVLDPLDGYGSEESEDEPMTRSDIPVIAIRHPYAFSIDGTTKPHHLVFQKQVPRNGKKSVHWEVLFDNVPYAGLEFEEFRHLPTVAWTGTRACDVVIMDAWTEQGLYFSDKTLHPVVIVRLDTEEEEGANDWEGARWQWGKLAHMIYLAYEKAALYIVDGTGEAKRVACI